MRCRERERAHQSRQRQTIHMRFSIKLLAFDGIDMGENEVNGFLSETIKG